VPTVGLLITDGKSSVAFSSTQPKRKLLGNLESDKAADALFIEASFPDEMSKLAEVSRHLTPSSLGQELKKLSHNGMDILAVHLKPTHRDLISKQLNDLKIPNLSVLSPGRIYNW
jgi:ribonuclease BN (tRNA processing enzyme)